jgi:hypothetical protein
LGVAQLVLQKAVCDAGVAHSGVPQLAEQHAFLGVTYDRVEHAVALAEGFIRKCAAVPPQPRMTVAGFYLSRRCLLLGSRWCTGPGKLPLLKIDGNVSGLSLPLDT